MTLTKITSKSIKDNEIVNADISASAAIAGTKVTPAFGSQNLSTTGTAATGALTVTGTGSFSSLIFANGSISYPDFQSSYYGTGLDLSIFHNGSNSIIKNKTGELQILANTANDVAAKFISDGAVELYHDNAKKAETTATGFSINGTLVDLGATHFGDVQFTGDNANIVFDKSDDALEFADNAKAAFGAGDDLQIYHDGTNSFIRDSGTGGLYIRGSSNVNIQNAAGTENKVRCLTDGAVELYYDNAKKFETTATGTTTTGNAIINNVTGGDALTINLADDNQDNVQINGGASQGRTVFRIKAGNATSGSATSMRWANSSDTDIGQIYIDNDTSHFKIMNNIQGNDIRFHTSSSENSNGAVHVASVTHRGSVQAIGDGESRPAFAFTNDTDSGMYKRGNNNIGFSTAGVGRYFMGGTALCPVQDNAKDLGTASNRWDDVRATNGNIVTSDKNEKNTITASDLGLDFVNKLTPVSYKYNNKTRTHYGLIAQDVETLLGTLSKSATDFAGFCKDTVTTDQDDKPLETPVDRYGLRYTEFISPIIKAIQELSTKVAALEAK